MCLFIKQFFTNPIRTGAVHPSSEQLADLITDTAELNKRKTIVEIGSGTGVFTEKICQKKDETSGFFVIELNPLFVKQTKKRCPTVKVFNDTAANINQYLTLQGYKGGCECIVSGLPWASFDDELQDSILDSLYESMAPDAVFLTFAYLPSLIMPGGRRFRKKLKEKFGTLHETEIIWKNIPPAFVYSVYKQAY